MGKHEKLLARILHLQEAGAKAKVYQVRQVRAILVKQRLGCEAEEGPPE